MTSKHLVDPELLPLFQQMPGFQFTREMLPAVRSAMQAARPAVEIPDSVSVTERQIPGPEGAPAMRVLITAPKEQAAKSPGQGRPGILHIHGGGYIIGTADMTIASDISYASEFGAVCVSVEYRLAPETAHPGPVEDCYAGLEWLHAHAEELGVDPARIAVTGESAGGGLAAATVLLARDRGQLPVRFQHLVFPMLDDRTVIQADPSPLLGEFVWTRESNRFGWAALLGHEPGIDGVSPYAAPARATDLAGLPPTFIATGALDLFLEENLEYSRRLIRAGVPSELHVYPGAPHGFMMVAAARVSRQFVRDSLDSLKRGLGVS
jgi:acetyl esterase/lipase